MSKWVLSDVLKPLHCLRGRPPDALQVNGGCRGGFMSEELLDVSEWSSGVVQF